MTVLSLAASQHTNLLRVDAPLSNPTYPIFYDLGTETVKVTDGADTTEWQVERGVADTQAARHIRGTLLVANASPYGGGDGGSVSTLAEVLAVGADPNGIPIAGAAGGAGDGGIVTTTGGSGGGGATGSTAQAYGAFTGGFGGDYNIRAGDGIAGSAGGGAAIIGGLGNGQITNPSAIFVDGGDGADAHGRVGFKTNNSYGALGQLLQADGGQRSTWATLTVRFAAGVPSGAPVGSELPIAFDSTAVTGGIYYWTGAAWVKGGTI